MKAPKLIKQRVRRFLVELSTELTENISYKDIAIVCSNTMDDEFFLTKRLAGCFRINYKDLHLYNNCYAYRVLNKKYYLVTETGILLVSQRKLQ